MRVYGEVVPDWERIHRVGGEIDLAAVENGGLVLSCSDMFFGHRHNLIMPGRAVNMSDGWETKRRRVPGNEWAVVRLARAGLVRRVEIDTDHFKGNAPGWCSLEACIARDNAIEAAKWTPIFARTALQPHARHSFEPELAAMDNATHVRLSIYPDGGVARLRLLGIPCPA